MEEKPRRLQMAAILAWVAVILAVYVSAYVLAIAPSAIVTPPDSRGVRQVNYVTNWNLGGGTIVNRRMHRLLDALFLPALECDRILRNDVWKDRWSGRGRTLYDDYGDVPPRALVGTRS